MLAASTLKEVIVRNPTLRRADLSHATIGHVAIVNDGLPEAYDSKPVEVEFRGRAKIEEIEAYALKADNVELRGLHARSINICHLRVDDTVDLSWTRVDSQLNLGFSDITILEAPKVVADSVRLFGARLSQVSMKMGWFGSVDATTASVDRVLSFDRTVIRGPLDAYSMSAGVLELTLLQGDRMTAGNARVGLLLLPADGVPPVQAARQFEMVGGGMRIDLVQGGPHALVQALMAGGIEKNRDTILGLESTLRKAGNGFEANAVAYHVAPLQAIVSGKVPGLGVGCIVLLFVVAAVAAFKCCRPCGEIGIWPRVLCAIDIVLPGLIDIGALRAWTDYEDTSRDAPDISVSHRGVAFAARLIGTLIVGYMLLYVTTLRAG
jgi:hypothetical protein